VGESSRPGSDMIYQQTKPVKPHMQLDSFRSNSARTQ